MKRVMLKSVLFLLVPVAMVFAQPETVFNNGVVHGIGARAIGMGGAYAAVGEDYSAIYWNPAALAQIRRFEFAGGLTHLNHINDAAFGNIERQANDSFTRLSELGIVYPVPTYRGSMVFSFGYNRVKSYDNSMEFLIYNGNEDFLVNQRWREFETGTMNMWSAAGAFDVSPNLSLGASINIWSGNDDYTFSLVETDVDNIYEEDEWRYDDSYDDSFSAFNLKLGALLRVNNQLRLAGAIALPRTITVSENWSYSDNIFYDDNTYLNDAEDDGDLEYKIKSPYTLTAGASFTLASFLLSGQLEYTDWKQIKYDSEPPVEGTTQQQANDEIRNSYRATTRIRLGGEFTLPGTMAQIRGGYFLAPGIREQDSDNTLYSIGFGYLLDKQTKIDFAYLFGNWERSSQDPFGDTIVRNLTEDISYRKFLATLSYRL